MLKAMIEKIEAMAKPEEMEICGRPYTTRPIFPVHGPKITPLAINTLTGVVDYLMSMAGDIEKGDCYIHIQCPDSVDIISEMLGPFLERQSFVRAKFTPKQFPFSRWHDLESFIISVQTFFIQDETTAAILKITGNLASGTSVEHLDDGITQQVKAKTGIARIENVLLPNPVTLRPYRTFLEIEQPPGQFVFRMRQTPNLGIECAIFEADCGLWQLEAIQLIYEWLSFRIPNVGIIR